MGACREELDACINWNWTDNKALKKEPHDFWKGGWKLPNSENWLCQLQSFDEVGRLWEQHHNDNPDEYAAVAFLRPDVLYLDPFPVSLLPEVKVRSCLVVCPWLRAVITTVSLTDREILNFWV